MADFDPKCFKLYHKIRENSTGNVLIHCKITAIDSDMMSVTPIDPPPPHVAQKGCKQVPCKNYMMSVTPVDPPP